MYLTLGMRHLLVQDMADEEYGLAQEPGLDEIARAWMCGVLNRQNGKTKLHELTTSDFAIAVTVGASCHQGKRAVSGHVHLRSKLSGHAQVDV